MGVTAEVVPRLKQTGWTVARKTSVSPSWARSMRRAWSVPGTRPTPRRVARLRR